MGDAVDAAGHFGEHVYSDAQHCMAIAGGCIVTYSKQPPDERYFAAWNAAAARLNERQPGLMSVVTVIDSGAQTPDDATRKLMAVHMKRYAGRIDRFAYVVEGRGFAAAAVRSAISLVNLTARTPYRQKVFASVEEAGAWLARSPSPSGSTIEASALTALTRSMRDKVTRLAKAG